MKTHHAIAFLAVLSLAPFAMARPVSAQQDSQDWLEQCRRDKGNRNRERSCEIRTETFRAGAGAIRISPGQNGGVSVESGVGNDIEVEARIQADAPDQSRAAAIGRSVRVAHSGNSIAASGPDMDGDNHESWSVMYVVRVPRNSDLVLNTTNGPMSIRNVRGHIEASTINGPLALSDVAGDVHARTKNGPLSVRLAGARWEGTGLDAETSNGPVTLSIPEDYNATLETGTTNGPFNTEIPLNVRLLGSERTSRINTTIGNGGPTVHVVTTNGPITIRRR